MTDDGYSCDTCEACVSALRAEGAAAERARIEALLEALRGDQRTEDYWCTAFDRALDAVRSASPSAAPSAGEDTQSADRCNDCDGFGQVPVDHANQDWRCTTCGGTR